MREQLDSYTTFPARIYWLLYRLARKWAQEVPAGNIPDTVGSCNQLPTSMGLARMAAIEADLKLTILMWRHQQMYLGFVGHDLDVTA